MLGLFALATPRRIKASHRRRGKVASGQSVQRYYDPGIGRFLSVDPVTANSGTGANFNRYWYANNNPYKFTDPDGRLACGGNDRCQEQLRELEKRGIPAFQAGASGSKSKSESSGCTECDEVRATRAGIMREGGEKLKEAGAFGLKEGAMMYGPAKLGGLLGKLGRFLGFAGKETRWVLGAGKSEAKWAAQMEKRGWTSGQISEAVGGGKSFPAENLVNRGNSATRFVHPDTGRSVVRDDVTREVLHVGGDGYKY